MPSTSNGLKFSTPVSAIMSYTDTINTDAKNLAAVGAVAGKEFTTYVFTYDTAGSMSGASSQTIRNLDQVGLPVAAQIDTHFSIGGAGFACVQDSSDTPGYVRNCTFYIDKSGDLVNTQGQYLLIFPADSSTGVISSSNPSRFNVNSTGQLAAATTNVDIKTILNSSVSPTDTTDNTFSQVITVYDSLGQSKSLNVTYTKSIPGNITDTTAAAISSTTSTPVTASAGKTVYDETAGTKTTYDGSGIATEQITFATPAAATATQPAATQAWEVTVSVVGDSSIIIDPPYDKGMKIDFDNSGRPVAFYDAAGTSSTPPTTTNKPPVLSIPVWGTTAAGTSAASEITLNFGDINESNGTISTGSSYQVRSFSANGYPQGNFKKLEFSEDGLAIVTFDNGKSLTYGQVALANFVNPRALSERAPGVFEETFESGNATIGKPGQGSFAKLVPQTYESSTANGTGVYVKLIEDQKNLVGNFKTIETMKRIYDRLQDI